MHPVDEPTLRILAECIPRLARGNPNFEVSDIRVSSQKNGLMFKLVSGDDVEVVVLEDEAKF